jgi:putative transposase
MRAYRTELDLTNKQRTACLQHAGAARVAYNWGLRRKIESYETTGKSPTAVDLHRELNALKHVPKAEGGFPWMYEISKCAPQEALRNLDRAFDGFFRRCKTGAKRKGYPKFKNRKCGIGTFTLTGAIRVAEKAIRLPRLGVLRLKERGYLPHAAKVIAATVSERAGRWFVSIRTDEPEPVRPTGTEILGVDVGIKSLAVLSDGTVFENPRALRKAEARLRHLQRAVNRKQKGSANRRKAIARLARQHYRVSCVRNDAIHKATSAIAKRAAVLGIESLNVAGMLRNHCLAKSLSDAALSEFLRQIGYKMKWRQGTVVAADPFYPSSKTCSDCGHVLDSLPLSVREWDCQKCHAHHDRDENAGRNLRNMAASSAVTACGGTRRSAAPVKQEPDATCPSWIGG